MHRAQCNPCPANAFCPGNDDEALVIPLRSFWLPDFHWNHTGIGGPSPLRCRHAGSSEICSPNFNSTGDWTNTTVVCSPGYTDRLCSRCEQAFFSFGQSCYPCASAWYWMVLSGVLAFGTMIAIVGYAYTLKPDESGGAGGELKVFIFFMQGAQLLPLFGVQGSAARVSGAAFLNIEFFGPECFVQYDFVSRFWTMMLVPVGALALVFCIYVVGRCVSRSREDQRESPFHSQLSDKDDLSRSWSALRPMTPLSEVSHHSPREREEVPFHLLDPPHAGGAVFSWSERNGRAFLFVLLFAYLPVVNSVLAMLPCDSHGYLLHAPY